MAKLIKFAGIPRSTYYYHSQKKNAPDKYSEVKTEITKIFTEHKSRYGYRRVTAELRSRGLLINHKTVRRLMNELNFYCTVRLKRYNSYRGNVGKTAPNLLSRDFNASSLNQKWVTDITEVHLFGKKIYLSPILDLYNGEIVSYVVSDHPRFIQVTDMLKLAFERYPDLDGLILHSDQGWQYRMAAYQKILRAKGIRQSMSRKGNCLDNAVMENFFGHLKSELLYNQVFHSVEEFIAELHEYITYYNEKRIRKQLGYLSPSSYRELRMSS